MAKKLLSVILILTVLLISIPARAAADSAVTNRKTPVYERANTLSAQLGTLSKGRSVTVTAEKGDWARIELNGKTGYVLLETLEKSNTATAYVISDTLTVYVKADSSSDKLGTLKYGASVTVSAEKNGWSKIVSGKKAGFVHSDGLSAKKPAPITKMYVSENKLPVYAKASTSSAKLGTLKYGAAVSAVKTRGAWTQIRSDGRVGYVKAKALILEKPYAKTAYVNVEKAKIYKKASLSSAVLGKVGVNTKLTVTAVSSSGTWAKVIWNGKTGYCPKSDLGTEKISLYASLTVGSSGEAVSKLQTRLAALGYYYGTVNDKYTSMTAASVKLFQKKAGLSDTGIADDATQKALYASGAPKADGASKPKSTAAPADGPSVLSDWFTGDIGKAFTKGTVAVLTDVDTKLSFRIYCTGGKAHPNCMPYSREDTAVMFYASKGKWNWTRRPCWISVNGVRYAASYTSMPEGSETINDNGYSGTFCVHFPGCLLNNSNTVCEKHQAAIKAALKAG